MDKLVELGDPDRLVEEEDLIVLKLDRPSTCPHRFPKRCLLDASCQLVTLNKETFVASRAFLGKQRFLSALFAGCEAFTSSNAFSSAARDILKVGHSLLIRGAFSHEA